MKKELPWQVTFTIHGTESYFCEGTIISSKTILTAAHCFDDEINRNFDVRIREEDLHSEQVITETELVLHPKYDKNTKNNDFALVFVHQELTFNETLMPACLPDLLTNYDNVAAVQGVQATLNRFGYKQKKWWFIRKQESKCGRQKQKMKNKTGKPPDRYAGYRRRFLNTMTNKKCREVLRCVSPNMLCAASHRSEFCQRTIGSPLVTFEKNKYYSLIGIPSWFVYGKDCFPGVYARVTSQLDWIISHTHGIVCPKPV